MGLADMQFIDPGIDALPTGLPSLQTNYTGLFQSNVVPSNTDTYVEFGAALSFFWATSLLPDNQMLANNAMVITAIDLAFSALAGPVTVSFQDSQGNVLQSQSVSPPGGTSLWGSFVWGTGVWGGTTSAYAPYQIPWTNTIVFKQGQLKVSGASGFGFQIGAAYMQYQVLGYVSQLLTGAS